MEIKSNASKLHVVVPEVRWTLLVPVSQIVTLKFKSFSIYLFGGTTSQYA